MAPSCAALDLMAVPVADVPTAKRSPGRAVLIVDDDVATTIERHRQVFQ